MPPRKPRSSVELPAAPHSIEQLLRLQQWRARPGREARITEAIAQTAHDVTKTKRSLGRLSELWTELVPAPLLLHMRLASLQRGVLHVTVDSSATGFELDRLLRQGLLDELRRRHTGTLVRVKTSVGTMGE